MNPEAATDRTTTEYFMDEKYGYSYFEVDEDNIVWQTDDYEPVRTNEPGQAVAKGKGIMKERPGSARGATPAPGTSGPAGQLVSFVPPQTPPKFYIKPEAPPIIGGASGHGRMSTAPFSSRGSQGLTAWYTSQSPNDIDVPIGRWGNLREGLGVEGVGDRSNGLAGSGSGWRYNHSPNNSRPRIASDSQWKT
ncbi:hypothetical protein BDP27DRAFT_1368410 [Rhodocollybia butyracea]|uniref:Uncharacterized protein n=1 Tax=Rhodocollybia butyracea TaxID=206335 RepID=A0A9P5U0U5_9AGAR|nr:hypothetical protein BDP27DRAFT_1368410 [Rhodocollybia butyracea]